METLEQFTRRVRESDEELEVPAHLREDWEAFCEQYEKDAHERMSNTMSNSYQLKWGYDRSKEPRMVEVHPCSVEDAKLLRSGDTVGIHANDGTLRRAKVNGKPKVWKKDPKRVEVPLKYGLYEYGTDTSSDGESMNLIVIPTSGQGLF